MLQRLFPKEENFFVLFNKFGELLTESMNELSKIVEDPKCAELGCFHLREIENRGDNLTHHTFELLHKTFITPFDREDIHNLITSLDDVIDLIETVAQRIYIFKIDGTTVPELKELTFISTECVKLVHKLLSHLDNLKNPDAILALCVEINRLENDADLVLRRSLARIFNEEPDVRQLIKLKEIFEFLEKVTDACENIANIAEGIVLDYA